VIEDVDLQNAGSFGQAESQPDISITGRRFAGRMIVSWVLNSYVIVRSPPCVFKRFQVGLHDVTTSQIWVRRPLRNGTDRETGFSLFLESSSAARTFA
jgi:hypothetical protein